jgi:Holliday junction DNA helicase RuvA
MFEYINGLLSQKSPSFAVIDVGGIGYECLISLYTFESLPKEGEMVRLFIHYYVREDIQKLYGFFSKTERDIFRKLIGISNIGPKTAISILSGVSPQDLISCIERGDASRLRKIPGVGDKTAQRLIVELRGQKSILKDVRQQSDIIGKSQQTPEESERTKAFEAMITLGYNEKQVNAALSRVEGIINKDAPVEEWIRKALQVI